MEEWLEDLEVTLETPFQELAVGGDSSTTITQDDATSVITQALGSSEDFTSVPGHPQTPLNPTRNWLSSDRELSPFKASFLTNLSLFPLSVISLLPLL